ncbi:hypothetical protein ABZ412_23660 [Nocardia sp. NPDC005746]|uniref:hypothetical protein n=1 Tax=unclassified Nocardia TaxID=2637762 RepID=UPI003411C344
MSEETPPREHDDDADPREDEKKQLRREHDEDRSPADPNDWNDDWDRARWAP